LKLLIGAKTKRNGVTTTTTQSQQQHPILETQTKPTTTTIKERKLLKQTRKGFMSRSQMTKSTSTPP
jgi:hypothetical protein